ncbi:MAG: mechanosensitive ion channel, partial [Phycisphaerae bacterium]|nr:mechanosensitive ion channel [Phycisphaerae bacterium]
KERLAEGETHENTTAESDANVDFNFETMELTAQVKRVLQTILGLVLCIGFWMIWNDVFPAIKGFQGIELWTTTINNEIQTIFLANLITAIIILFLMMVLGHNLPGLLDLAVLEQLRFDKGGRFAIKTTMRYIIYVVGTVMAFGEIGIGWGKVQWLVGAMLVGLGFGLQEIFANFVSGLLILFEQPIRVDDIVTVDNTSGKVTKIRIRATTIRDWDRKEYIVPNKEFITGRLLNWTLSDKLNRIVIKVGIAYGSNVELALSELNRVVREHPLTMDDPEPVITFEEFGESSLNLVVRCFLPNLDDRLKTITELHKGIDNAFRAANIEIAFPQQDIHIRSIKGKLNVDPLAGQHPDPPGLLP